MAAPAQASDLAARQNFDVLFSYFHSGDGDPNGRISARTGAFYLNNLGGAGNTLWIKESSPTPTTGWVAK